MYPIKHIFQYITSDSDILGSKGKKKYLTQYQLLADCTSFTHIQKKNAVSYWFWLIHNSHQNIRTTKLRNKLKMLISPSFRCTEFSAVRTSLTTAPLIFATTLFKNIYKYKIFKITFRHWYSGKMDEPQEKGRFWKIDGRKNEERKTNGEIWIT